MVVVGGGGPSFRERRVTRLIVSLSNHRKDDHLIKCDKFQVLLLTSPSVHILEKFCAKNRGDGGTGMGR